MKEGIAKNDWHRFFYNISRLDKAWSYAGWVDGTSPSEAAKDAVTKVGEEGMYTVYIAAMVPGAEVTKYVVEVEATATVRPVP